MCVRTGAHLNKKNIFKSVKKVYNKELPDTHFGSRLLKI